MKAQLLAIFAAFILVFGCASQEQPPLPPQPSPQPDTGTGVLQPGGPKPSNNTTAAPSGSQTTCSLTLSPSTIRAGESADVGFSVFADDDTQFTFNCGDEIRSIATGGLTSGSRLCQFNEAGEQQVWIKADGIICAQKALRVLPVSSGPKNCYINESTIKKDFGSHYYEFTVHFTGFEPQDEIVWVCDYTTAKKQIGEAFGFGMPKKETLSCDYSESPRKDFIDVSIGGTGCGRVSTR